MKKIFGLFVFLITMLILSSNIYAYDFDVAVKECECVEVQPYEVTFRFKLEPKLTLEEGEDLSTIEVPEDATKTIMIMWNEGENPKYSNFEEYYYYTYNYNRIYTIRQTVAGLKQNTTYYYQVIGSDEINSFKTPPDDEITVYVTTEYEPSGYVIGFNCNNLKAGEDKFYVVLKKDGKSIKTYTRLYEGQDITIDNITVDYDYSRVFIWKKDSMMPITWSGYMERCVCYEVLFGTR